MLLVIVTTMLMMVNVMMVGGRATGRTGDNDRISPPRGKEERGEVRGEEMRRRGSGKG